MVYKSSSGLNLPIAISGGGGSSGRVQSFPVAILWDIENCPVPNEVSAENVAGNVRMALNMHPAIRGAVTTFSAYGDFNHFPRKLREGCQRTGVNLIDVPNTKKDASDKAILVDMFLFALDNPPPCTIFLISGDVDFAPALHKLGQRGYTVVLAIPSGFVSGSLSSAGRYVWDWTSLARGMGLVPLQPRESFDVNHRQTPSDESGDESFRAAASGAGPVSSEWNFSPPFTQGYLEPDPRLSQAMRFQQQPQQSQQQQQPQGQLQNVASPSNHGRSLEPSITVSSDAAELEDEPRSPTSFVQPGDLSGLKRQLVRLLSLQGGSMKLVQVPPEYSKLYGRPLYLSDYNTQKLVHLLDKLQDAVLVKGDPKDRTVHLTKGGTQLASKYNWTSTTVVSSSSKAAKASSAAARKQQQQQQQQQAQQVQQQQQHKQLLNQQEQLLQEEEQNSLSKEEETKDVVEEEVVVFMSKREETSDSASGSQDEQEFEEVEVQEVVVGTASLIDAVEPPDDADGDGDGAVVIQVVDELETRQEVFRQELQELLVSYACHILVGDLERLYRQRYSKEIDYAGFGLEEGELEMLLEKVKDVGLVRDVQGGNGRMLVANLGILPQIGTNLTRTFSELILL